jgi:hypothetical protein
VLDETADRLRTADFVRFGVAVDRAQRLPRKTRSREGADACCDWASHAAFDCFLCHLCPPLLSASNMSVQFGGLTQRS